MSQKFSSFFANNDRFAVSTRHLPISTQRGISITDGGWPGRANGMSTILANPQTGRKLPGGPDYRFFWRNWYVHCRISNQTCQQFAAHTDL